MSSQITKDFSLKSKLRKLADGGSPRPEMLGTGMAAQAARNLSGRGRQIDQAVDDATGTVPAPAPAPAPAPVAAAPAPTPKKGLRGFLGLADGGVRPEDITGGTATSIFSPAEMENFNAMGAGAAGSANASALQAIMDGQGAAAQAAADAAKSATEFRGFQHGGAVEGPGGPTDDKIGPVMLSDEEYVLPADTTKAIGREKLDALRLATHDFKSDAKESALRQKVKGLADGGTWIADDKGNVRKPNSFGDAAAGPGYQQPRLPPPQPGTAVGPARVPPMGQRPPIDMGMVDEVPRQSLRPPTSTTPGTAPWSGPPPVNGNVGPGGSKEAQMFRNAAGNSSGDAAAASANTGLSSKAGSALRTAGNVLAKGAGVVGAGMAAKDMYDNGVGVGNSGDLLASGAAFAGPVGAAAAGGWGAGRAIGGSLSEDTRDMIGGVINQGVRNIGGLFGQDWGVDDSALLEQKANARLAEANRANVTASPVAAATSALRSDQGAALPVTPGSYQSRRLSEMGVPLDVQNENPVTDTRTAIASGGTDKFQNLGTYGGNGNIYGRASDSSKPGRINDFAGVGAGASPQNEANGSGWDAALKSALRGAGSPAPQQGGGYSNNSSEINARYDKMAKELSGMYGPKGQGNLARRMLELEQGRSNALDADSRNMTALRGQDMTSATSRDNAQLTARTNMIEAMGRMEQNRNSMTATAQANQIKALQEAQKTAREGEEKGFGRYNDAIGQMFSTTDKDGKQIQDKAQQERFRSFVEGSDPQAGQKFSAMSPQQQMTLLQNFKTMFDMNEVRNKTAQSGSWPSNTGGVTNRIDMPTDVREATFNDYWNNNLPLKDYIRSNLWGTNKNVVVTESGQPTLYSDYTSTGGARDLDKEKIVRDSVSARSKLRSN